MNQPLLQLCSVVASPGKGARIGSVRQPAPVKRRSDTATIYSSHFVTQKLQAPKSSRYQLQITGFTN